ncbi:MAG: 16S rRNA (guanine(527)-N(7))-methyltransferase RsmG [Chitinivorax sp.]|jgi:16S rRNA (guanine527-N7)-methyltransferase
MSADLARQLQQGIAALGMSIAEPVQRKLLDYILLLDKWNKVYSLTAVREPERMIGLHLLDCLAMLPYVKASRLLDVGSGGGMPGIILAICHPEWQVTMIDSNSKKTGFLQQAAISLQLGNVTVVTSRVEQYQPAQPFDVITSRAFADLGDFVAWSQHLLAPGGCYAAMKGVYPQDEVARLPAGFVVSDVVPLQVPGLDAERHLLTIRAA